ncbi:unnamed protein product [Penicillium pancosmium]
MDGTECSLREYRRRRYTFDKQYEIVEQLGTRNTSKDLDSSRSCHRVTSEANTSWIDTWEKFSSTVVDRESAGCDGSEPLFPYFKPVPSNLHNTELSYLNNKGAFEVPPPNLLRQLLTAYLQFAYGYMPIIDLHELLGSFMQVPSTAISRLLFQCLLFAGVAFVDVTYLEAAGFKSRGEAHDHYFDKARLLYDFDYEQDPLALIQALAMMSHWNQRSKCHKDSLHWLECSLSLAFKHELHREELADVGSMRNNGLRKRLWWAIYSQSKILSLSISYPLRSINQRDFNVSLPSLADFDFRDFPSTVLDMLHECSIIRCIEEQEILARMFLQKVSICLLSESGVQVHCESSLRPCGFHSTVESRSFPATWAGNDVQDPGGLPESYSEKWYQSTKDERNSFSEFFLTLPPIGKARRLYHLHLMLLKTLLHHPSRGLIKTVSLLPKSELPEIEPAH